MATVTDFVVGLGFDSTAFDRGIKRSEQALGSFRSNVLQIGATLAGAFSLDALTFGFAEQKEGMRQFAQSIGLAANKYAALAQAAQSFGASESEVQGILSQMAKDRAAMAKGDFNYTDLAITGVDWGRIHNAKDDVEALISLADQWQKLSLTQRINTAQYYGLSSQMIDMLNQGEDGVRSLMKTFNEARPYTDEMGDVARRFNAQWAVLSATLGGFSDRIAMPFIDDVSDIIESVNRWADANKGWLNSGAELIGENLTALVAAISALPLAKLAGIVGWIVDLAGLFVGIKASNMDDELDLNGDGIVTNAERADVRERQLRENAEATGEAIPQAALDNLEKLRNTPDEPITVDIPDVSNPASAKQGIKALGYDDKQAKDRIIGGAKTADAEKRASTRSDDKKTLIINNYIDTPAFSRMIVDLDMDTWNAASQQSKSTTDR